jgi:hypothetical protein
MTEVRFAGSGRWTFGVMFVPEQEVCYDFAYNIAQLVYNSFNFQEWVVERLGKFHRTLQPGLNFLIPIVDNIKYVYSLKDIAVEFPSLSAVTSGLF